MQRYLKFIRSNATFLVTYLMIVIFLAPVFISIPKDSLHLFINHYHSSTADISFKYLTYLGDGLTPFLVAIVFVFFSFRNALQICSAGTLAGLMAQFFKRLIFPGIQRPYAIFKELPQFHIVNGIDMHSSFSFPSGHAATIFAMCFIIAGLTENKILKIILLFTALLVAFSRVYLSQHFLVDMYAGSFIGILSALLIFVIFDRFKAKWLDSSLLLVTKKITRNE